MLGAVQIKRAPFPPLSLSLSCNLQISLTININKELQGCIEIFREARKRATRFPSSI